MSRKWIFLTVCLCAILGAWWWFGRREETPATPPVAPPAPPATARAKLPDPPRIPTSVAAARTTSSPFEIARVVENNSVPGRMVFVQINFTARGAVATHATGAAGRAKAGALQSGAGHLQYEVYSPTGDITLVGSVVDPLHQRYEYEDQKERGKIRSTIVDRKEGFVNLRLPGEANPARLVFFREVVSESAGVTREPAGEVTLR